MKLWVGIVVVIIIILIVYCWKLRRESFQDVRSFMTGFWCASPLDCDMKGYRAAYLFMGMPENDTNISRAYIVALKGGRGIINRPFDFDVHQAFTGNAVCGRMRLNNREICDVAINIDLLTGRMIWRDTFGKPLFVWEKNSRVTSDLFEEPGRAPPAIMR